MRTAFLLISAALLPLVGHAQAARRHYDAQGRAFYRGPARLTLGGGVALYNGDLAAGLGQIKPGPAVQGGVIYPWRPHWAVGGEFGWFRLGATDQLEARNIGFQGNNASLTTFLRFEPLRDPGQYALTRQSPAPVRPFVQAGVGMLLYNPTSYRGSQKPSEAAYYLAPERADYPATAITFPLSGGATFRLTDVLHLTAQATYAFTTTDQLDDVSTLHGGNSDLKDGYGLVEVKIEYALK